MCLHFARKLLSERTQWPLDIFTEAWQSSVPEVCMSRNSSCDSAWVICDADAWSQMVHGHLRLNH